MEERKRALVLGRVIAGRLTIPDAALLLGLSERSVWRLKSRFVAADLVLAAVFRDTEDAAGYFTLLERILRDFGVPLATYSDRHGIFWRSPRERESIEEELLGRRQPTQLGRAFAECGIELILANSSQAKGRVERLFGTFQDRLVGELRLAAVVDLARANGLLTRHLSR